jgi:hypothetical protein
VDVFFHSDNFGKISKNIVNTKDYQFFIEMRSIGKDITCNISMLSEIYGVLHILKNFPNVFFADMRGKWLATNGNF